MQDINPHPQSLPIFTPTQRYIMQFHIYSPVSKQQQHLLLMRSVLPHNAWQGGTLKKSTTGQLYFVFVMTSNGHKIMIPKGLNNSSGI